MADQNGEEEDYDDWKNSAFEPNSFGVNENGNGQGMASGNQIPRQEQRGSLPPISSLSNLSPQNQASGESGQFDDFGPPVLSREVVLSQEVVSPQYQMERQNFQGQNLNQEAISPQSHQYQMERQDFQGQNLASGQRYGQNFQGQSQDFQGQSLLYLQHRNQGQNLALRQSSIRGQRNLVSGPNLAPEQSFPYPQGNQGRNLPSQYIPYPNSKIPPQYQQGHISPPTSNNVPFFSGYSPQEQNNFQGFVPNDPYAQVSKNAGSQISYSVAPKSVGPQMSKSVGPQFPNPHNFPQQYGKVSPPILTKQFSGHPPPLMFQNQLVNNNLNLGASRFQPGPGKTLKKPRKSPQSKTSTSPEKRAQNRKATERLRRRQMKRLARLMAQMRFAMQFVGQFLTLMFYQFFGANVPENITQMIDFVFDISFVGSVAKHTGVKERCDQNMYKWQQKSHSLIVGEAEEKLRTLNYDENGFKFMMEGCLSRVKSQGIEPMEQEKNEGKKVQPKQREAKQREAKQGEVKKRGRKPKNVNK